MKTVKVCIGLPWYDGPDVDCYPLFFEQMHYYGRMRERCEWLNWVGKEYGRAAQEKALADIPALDPNFVDGGRAELCEGEYDTIFEFGLTDETRLSLPGLARERIVENALRWGADYLFMWDYDMQFAWSTFIRLWRRQKPLVAALAFTAREPFQPVIYRIVEKTDPATGPVYISEPVLDYPKDTLVGNAQIDGSLAFGGGVFLANMNIFKQIPKPWFHSTGCGEDWMFCVRCHIHGVPRYVDTSVKTAHKEHKPRFVTEETYVAHREHYPDAYDKLMGK